MDVIARGNLAISNHGGRTTLSFVVPSLKEIDYNAIASEENFKEATKGMSREQRRAAERKARSEGELPPKRR